MSGTPIYIQFRGPNDVVEAVATRYKRGKVLPGGYWLVTQRVDGMTTHEIILVVDDMPNHWVEQLRQWAAYRRKK